MRKMKIAMTVLLLILPFCPAFAAAPPNPKALFKTADVVLEVIPIKAHPVDRGTSVDAIEGTDTTHFALAEAMVTFKIRRILKGKWERVKVGGPGRFAQASKAMKKKDYLKILTLNFSDPNKEIDKEWVSVAVEDPGKSFGIRSWDAPESRRCKIYLKTIPHRTDSYVMIGSIIVS